MGKFSQIEHATWGDSAVTELSAPAALLFVWSFTNGPCASLTGLTLVGARKLRRAARVDSEDALAAVLDELAAKPLVLYDWDHELLWCFNRVRFANASPKTTTGINNWVSAVAENVNGSPLLAQFRRRYAPVLRGDVKPQPTSEHQMARNKLSRAVASGKVVRGSCEREGDDCRGPIEGHHDDYSKPLDVRWFCQHHHRQIERES